MNEGEKPIEARQDISEAKLKEWAIDECYDAIEALEKGNYDHARQSLHCARNKIDGIDEL